MAIESGRIDVHHHIIPPAFTETMKRKGITKVAGAVLPDWDAKRSIEMMDLNGIQTAITSLSAPGVYFGNLEEAVDLARKCNEFASEMKEKHPNRFGYFAVLPMPFTDKACKEAIYALDNLNADGIVLLGSTEGKFLGNPQLEELMAELDRRKTIVFVHPNIHQTSDTLDLNTPGFLVEFLCDTTRAAVNLILSGTIEKYPNINWILAHAGGFLPYIAWRISLANMFSEFAVNIPQGVLTYIKRFYFDTALSPSPMVHACLKELVEPSHILYGSDFPFAPEPVTAMQIKMLEKETKVIWDDKTMHGINRGHALSLFPKYKSESEVVAPRPIFKGMGMKHRVKRTAMKPVIGLIEKLRGQ